MQYSSVVWALLHSGKAHVGALSSYLCVPALLPSQHPMLFAIALKDDIVPVLLPPDAAEHPQSHNYTAKAVTHIPVNGSSRYLLFFGD